MSHVDRIVRSIAGQNNIGLFDVLTPGFRDCNSEPQDRRFRGKSCPPQNHILGQYRFHISVSGLKAVLRDAAHIAGVLFGSRELSLEKGEFKAVVEVDNLSSQKCFERLCAKLAGLCDSAVLKTGEEKKRFEERNLDLIDAHMVELAGRLGIDPRALLSNLLDYRLTCTL